MPLGPSEIGVASVASAATLAAVKTIDFLVRKKPNGNGNSSNGHCKAQQCDAKDVIDRLQEYHEENRDVLRDIRDGIKLIAHLLERRKTNRDL